VRRPLRLQVRRPVVPDEHPVRCCRVFHGAAGTAGTAMTPVTHSAHIQIGCDDPASKFAMIGVLVWIACGKCDRNPATATAIKNKIGRFRSTFRTVKAIQNSARTFTIKIRQRHLRS